jgi:hypothetical protein
MALEVQDLAVLSKRWRRDRGSCRCASSRRRAQRVEGARSRILRSSAIKDWLPADNRASQTAVRKEKKKISREQLSSSASGRARSGASGADSNGAAGADEWRSASDRDRRTQRPSSACRSASSGGTHSRLLSSNCGGNQCQTKRQWRTRKHTDKMRSDRMRPNSRGRRARRFLES